MSVSAGAASESCRPTEAQSCHSAEVQTMNPKFLETLQHSFVGSIQAMALVVALFAGIQAQLLSSIPSSPTDSVPQGLINALQFFTYVGLAANIGAALAAMVFLDLMGECFLRFKLSTHTGTGMRPGDAWTYSLPDLRDLSRRGAPDGLELSFYHCIISVIIGSCCLLLQVILLAWVKINETATNPAVFAITVVMVSWAFLPFPRFIVYRFFVGLGKGFVEGMKETDSGN